MKIRLSERLVLDRLNKALSKDHRRIKKCRLGTPAYQELGRYCLIDTQLKLILAKQVNIEDLARGVGSLKSYEEMMGELESAKEARDFLRAANADMRVISARVRAAGLAGLEAEDKTSFDAMSAPI